MGGHAARMETIRNPENFKRRDHVGARGCGLHSSGTG